MSLETATFPLTTSSQEEYNKIYASAENDRKNGTLTSEKKINFISSSLKNGICNKCEKLISMKLFFDISISFDKKPLQKEYVFNTEKPNYLEKQGLLLSLQTIFYELKEAIIEDKGKMLKIEYTAFFKYDDRFESIDACIGNKTLFEGSANIELNGIIYEIKQFLMHNKRDPNRSHLDESLDFILVDQNVDQNETSVHSALGLM